MGVEAHSSYREIHRVGRASQVAEAAELNRIVPPRSTPQIFGPGKLYLTFLCDYLPAKPVSRGYAFLPNHADEAELTQIIENTRIAIVFEKELQRKPALEPLLRKLGFRFTESTSTKLQIWKR